MRKKLFIIDTYYKIASGIFLTLLIILPALGFSFYTVVGRFTDAIKYFIALDVIGLWSLYTFIYITFRSFRVPIKLPVLNKISWLLLAGFVYTISNAITKGVYILDKDVVQFSLCVLAYFLGYTLFQSNVGGLIKKIMLWLLLIAGSIEAITGLLQLYRVLPSLNAQFPITGTFRNPAPFSLYLAVILPISLSIFLFSNSYKGKSAFFFKGIALSTMFLTLSVLPVAGIRSSWIASAAGMFVVLEYKYGLIAKIKRHATSLKKKIFLSTLLSCLLLSMLYALYYIKPQSAAGRIVVWEIAGRQFSKHPILGVGYTNFRKRYNIWQAEFFKENPDRLEQSPLGMGEKAGYLADNVQMAYDEYLELAIESGIIGAGLFLYLITVVLVSTVKNIYNSFSVFSVGMLGSFVAFLIAALFSYPLQSPPTHILFYVMLSALSAEVIKMKGRVKSGHMAFPRVTWQLSGNILCGVMVVVIFIWSANSLSKENAYEDWKTAKLAVLQDQNESAERQYLMIYPKLKSDELFLIDYSYCLIIDKHYDNALEILQQAKSLTSDSRVFLYSGECLSSLGYFKEAVKEYEMAHFIVPHQLFPLYLLAKLYESKGDTLSATSYATEILKRPPKFESGLSDQIFREMTVLLARYRGTSDSRVKISSSEQNAFP